jgi:hypothetical protein
MSLLIVGAQGNMGQRYQAILRYLQLDSVGVDQNHSEKEILRAAMRSEGVIIATPTSTHVELSRLLLKAKKPVLCEKPITKNVAELKELMAQYEAEKVPYRMVYQYRMLLNPDRIGGTFYDYFKHGSDGLIWDCLQIIGLGRSDIRLKEKSPVWSCRINGQPLRLDHMDAAYIGYVQSWLRKPEQDRGEIIAIHEKTADFESSYKDE